MVRSVCNEFLVRLQRVIQPLHVIVQGVDDGSQLLGRRILVEFLQGAGLARLQGGAELE